MRAIRSLLVVLLVITGVFIMPSCISQGLVLEQQELEMEIGDSIVLKVKDMDPGELEWSSDSPSVAAVNKIGEVRALGPGSAVITVASGKRTAKISVVITGPKHDIVLTPGSLVIGPGKTEQVQAEVFHPIGGLVIWASEDSDIAKVDSAGYVTGMAVGKTRVIASIGDRKAVCEVTVSGITPGNLLLERGETKQVQYESIPAGESVLWTSEDTGIAEVDQSGNVTAVGMGFTNIIASIGGREAKCEVTVNPPEINKERLTGVPVSGSEGPPTLSPDGSLFVYYIAEAPGKGAVLMDLQGNESELPGFHVGPVSWRGSKFVWQAGYGMFADAYSLIYVYDTLDHTHTDITYNLPRELLEPREVTPVLTSNNTVSLVLSNGLWNCDLDQGKWTQALTFQAEVMDNGGWPALIWSPDLKRVAWLEQGEEDTRLVLLEIDSGNITKIHQQPHFDWSDVSSKLQPIIHIAWSKDSTKLAVAGGGEDDIKILSLQGDLLKSLPFTGSMSSLTWVPGQDKIAYGVRDGLIIRNLADGNMGLVNVNGFYHAWLQNGNLALLSPDESGGQGVLEIFELNWGRD